MPKLIVQHQGREWTEPLKAGSNVLGRQSTCDLSIKDPQLSRQHCDFVLAGSTCLVVDKGSMNGTLVNGKRVKAEQALQPGDKIVVGPVTLWYERKNQAVEAPTPPPSRVGGPSPRPGPAPGAEIPSPSAQVATRRAVAQTTSARPAEAEVEGLPADYAVRVKAGGAGVRIAAAVLVAGLLAVGAYAAKSWLPSESGPKDDRTNLVRNGAFELSGDSWVLREKGAGRLGVADGQGRGGSRALVLDKASGPAEYAAFAMYPDDHPLPAGAAVELSMQVRFDGGFAGTVAPRIEWLRSPRGPLIAEQHGHAARAGDWTAVEDRFTPPAGAGAFRVGFAALGRGGRIVVDDVKARAAAGEGPEREVRLGAHAVRATAQGVFQLGLRGPLAISNVQVRLDSDKEGSVAQASAAQVSSTSQDGALAYLGKLPHPAGLPEVEFEQQLVFNEGGTEVWYRFKAEALRQIDRVTILCALPRGAEAPDAESLAQPRVQIPFRSDDGDFVLEYSDPARVSHRAVEGRLRLAQSFAVVSPDQELAVGVKIRESGGGGSDGDPVKGAARAREARKFGEALSLLKIYAGKVREPAVKEKVDQEIRTLEDAERRDWMETQASAFQALLLRRPENVARALEGLDTYARQWSSAAFDGKVATLRNELARVPAPGQDDAEEGRKIVARAKALAAAGKRALAEVLLRSVVARTGTGPVADEARALLQGIGN